LVTLVHAGRARRGTIVFIVLYMHLPSVFAAVAALVVFVA